ncbi:MG2 domain-containing protein [Xanthocytophaga flava]|uniref:MG2 domain-containing protein n=1 Tax=Xanthocytophaga flava TaxID=3048013 RepID=UPI0028D58DE7|nr:MG2 domain-containing protein [Xanthocytophaga flavus]MDJ1467582.1 TonB-dependent receptor plug domain-containing protein [Xanthocytophaga flavus]
MKTKFILLFISLSILCLSAFKLPMLLPANFLDYLRQKTEAYTDKIPDEKLYIHTDRTFYKPGEDIWFKGYLANGLILTADAASHVVYVELVNPRGTVEKTLQLLVKKGSVYGDFHLEESAPGGLYKLRAYTQWMRNQGPEAFFEKEIQVQKVLTPRLLMKLDFTRKAYGAGDPVVADLEMKDLQNHPLTEKSVTYTVQIEGKQFLQAHAVSDKNGKASIRFTLPADLQTTDGLLNITILYEGNTESISRSIPIVLNKIALQFFPEGGDLVAGIPSRVAFKAINEFGKPADIEGYVTDETGKKLQSFKSFHQGMGAFALTPSQDQQYIVHITQPAISQTYALPAALPKGYVLSVDTVTAKQIQLSFHAPASKPIYLVGQVRGKIYYTKEISAETGHNQVSVPLKDFPIGIAQITLFDYNQVPRCERLVFVNAQRKMHISVTTDKKHYSPREKVDLTIRTVDEDSLPVPANLSLSVADDRLVTFADDKQDNILSHMLMSSDLRGKIEEPFFYFKPNEPKASKALDYVMMTHGWRRFTWQQVQEGPQNMIFAPEKTGNLSGTILDARDQKPLSATVTLFELDDKRRSAQLTTGSNGRFLFQAINPKVAIQLFAQAPGVFPQYLYIRLDQEPTSNPGSVAANQDFKWQNEAIKEKAVATPKRVQVSKPNPSTKAQSKSADVMEDSPFSLGDMSLSADVQALNEVVVVGYATQRKQDLTSAVATVQSSELNIFPSTELSQTLQGRISGVQITQSDGAPGSVSGVQIRGVSSIANSDPLYVVDGTLVTTPEFISPTDIASISVLKSGEATALYGSRGSNGVIVITTKKDVYYKRSIPRNKLPISQVYIAERKFSVAREFYIPVYDPKKAVAERTDFRSTIYWNHEIQTDARTGTAHVSFYNSDQVTAFRVTTEGMSTSGLAGRAELTYATQLPFSIEAKIPPYLTFEDRLEIPISLKNTTSQAIHGELTIKTPPQLKITAFNGSVYSLPGEAKTLYLHAEVQPVAGKGTLTLIFQGDGMQETVSQEIDVQPKGFPTEMAYSGKEKEAQFSFTINEPVKGSIKAELKAYPNLLNELLNGIESVLREPYGCFEQTSSSTYPNVLVLQYLRESGTSNPKLEKQALDYIDKGYKRLIGFETKEDGFEWFGHTPPHEALTAFGLAEFTEMKKVYDGVDEKMLRRTKQWILSRRDGKGSFILNPRHMYSIPGSDQAMNAYIVYALTEAGIQEIRPEYENSYQIALKNQDLYQMALLANAAFNLKDTEKGEKLITECTRQINEKGLEKAKMATSMTSSYGQSLQIETASLLLQALLKTTNPDETQVQKLVNKIVKSRKYGGFGSTQATILALKSLTEYAKFVRHTSEGGNLLVYMGEELIGSQSYEKDAREDITITGIERFMKEGKQPFRVVFENTKTALPYSMNVSWASQTPNSAPECKVDVETQLSHTAIQTGQTVRMTTSVKNKTSETLPMTVALVGIPSGLSPQPWQLKELQEKKIVDFYEVRKNYVVFYYRKVAPKDWIQIQLDLKAEVPGTFTAPASTAYLYYTNEFKDWEGGEKIEILK